MKVMKGNILFHVLQGRDPSEGCGEKTGNSIVFYHTWAEPVLFSESMSNHSGTAKTCFTLGKILFGMPITFEWKVTQR